MIEWLDAFTRWSDLLAFIYLLIEKEYFNNLLFMTHRERMLAAIRGEPIDQIPWAPRMDLWYIAQRARGSLSKQFVGLNMAELADAMGVACHSVGGDYTFPPEPANLALRGLGLGNHPDFCFRISISGLPVTSRWEGDSCQTVIHTPAGDVTTLLEISREMKRNGISNPFIKQFPIRSADDFEAVAQVFEHVEVTPTPDAYAKYRRRIGDRGLAVPAGPVASPMHHIFHDLVSLEQFFYLYADERDGLISLAKRMEPFFDKLFEAALACEAEVLFWGANYDQNTTWPAFFQEEIAPWLKRRSDQAHAAGRFLLTHTDGENQKLLPLYPACGFDVAESVCPKPMTRCTLKEVREGMGPKVTVWGGLCSIAFLRDSMSDAAFEAYLDQTFGELGTGERLILGVSDMVPPDADLKRLERIKERVRNFGAVRPARK